MGFNQGEVSTDNQMQNTNNHGNERSSDFEVITIQNVVDALQKDNPNLDDKAALEIAEGFNDAQKSGVYRLQLSKEQVERPNFGWHTLFAMNRLIKDERASNVPEAYDMVADFNDAQTRGFTYYNLSREKVENPVFGWHTLFAMNRLIIGINDMDSHLAFEWVGDYNEDGIRQLSKNELLRDFLVDIPSSSISKQASSKLGEMTKPLNEGEKKRVSSDSDLDTKPKAKKRNDNKKWRYLYNS